MPLPTFRPYSAENYQMCEHTDYMYDPAALFSYVILRQEENRRGGAETECGIFSVDTVHLTVSF